MWWVALFFDRLALDLVRLGSAPAGRAATTAEREAPPARHGATSADADPPLAICDRQRILDADDLARAHGVAPGMKRASALALASTLVLREHDDAQRQAAIESLAAWALQFTPSVSLQSDLAFGELDDTLRPCGLLLEVAPSLRCFGGGAALLRRLREGLCAIGLPARVGVAPSATAAWLFARHRDGLHAGAAELEGTLRALPAALLARTTAQRATLDAIGARHVDDLLALPRAGLARRCGRALLDELDRALGRQPEPRRWFEAPERFDARIELLAQVEHAEALLFTARRLLEQLAGWLAARHGGLRECVVHAEHDRRYGGDSRPDTRLEIRLADPSRDPERLCGLLRAKLAVTRLVAPVRALRLRCDEVLPLPGASESLFPGDDTAREGVARLVERLQARLGPREVQRLQVAADHRPEAAWRAVPADASHRPKAGAAAAGATTVAPHTDAATHAPRTDAATAHAAVACLPRPLWLLDSPIPIGERNSRPWWRSALTLLAGPERIESGWWDGAPVQRDYFVAEDETHVLYWIYRERLAPEDTRAGWFVHGRFG